MSVMGPISVGSRKPRKVRVPKGPKTKLDGITEETDSEAESWEEVPEFESTKTDINMVDLTTECSSAQSDTSSENQHQLESPSTPPWENQLELDAAQHLTTLYNQLLVDKQCTPEQAYNLMLQEMKGDAQLHMFYKWDHNGRVVG